MYRLSLIIDSVKKGAGALKRGIGAVVVWIYNAIKSVRWGTVGRFVVSHVRLTVAAVGAIAVVVIGSIIINKYREWNAEPEHRQIVLEETPIQIEAVRPKGEMYVASSVIEDYTTMQKTEKKLGLFPKEHSCVQILRQKCSYVLNLDSIEYIPDGEKRVLVRLPKLEYVASTQKSPFMSDDEDYWTVALPSTNGMKAKVAKQIKQKFCTDENEKKAMRYAEQNVTVLLKKLGYEVEFISTLETKERR